MYTLYVGSPNDTHKLDSPTLQNVKDIISKHFESFTYFKARGVYKGTEEDTVVITIADAQEAKVYELGRELCSYLKQDAVGIVYDGTYQKITTD